MQRSYPDPLSIGQPRHARRSRSLLNETNCGGWRQLVANRHIPFPARPRPLVSCHFGPGGGGLADLTWTDISWGVVARVKVPSSSRHLARVNVSSFRSWEGGVGETLKNSQYFNYRIFYRPEEGATSFMSFRTRGGGSRSYLDWHFWICHTRDIYTSN